MNKVLTIAGSDSCCGAGVQADLKVISALGAYGTCAITAMTAQNSLGVSSVFSVPASVVAQQIDAVVSDIGADSPYPTTPAACIFIIKLSLSFKTPELIL